MAFQSALLSRTRGIARWNAVDLIVMTKAKPHTYLGLTLFILSVFALIIVIIIGQMRPSIGTEMPDGTIYAGRIETFGDSMFILPVDLSVTGRRFNLSQAKLVCDKIAFGGHDDWRLPTKTELSLLYLRRHRLPDFQDDMYWSSTAEESSGFVWLRDFKREGASFPLYDFLLINARCVRSE